MLTKILNALTYKTHFFDSLHIFVELKSKHLENDMFSKVPFVIFCCLLSELLGATMLLLFIGLFEWDMWCNEVYLVFVSCRVVSLVGRYPLWCHFVSKNCVFFLKCMMFTHTSIWHHNLFPTHKDCANTEFYITKSASMEHSKYKILYNYNGQWNGSYWGKNIISQSLTSNINV